MACALAKGGRELRLLPACAADRVPRTTHQAAVNSITFIDEGRRFVSSSDDKSLRLWEYGIPVVGHHPST